MCAGIVSGFWLKAGMRGLKSNNIFIPQAEVCLQVPMVQEGQCTDALCFYSLEFTSTLLSDNDVLCSGMFCKDYCRQLMITYLNQKKRYLKFNKNYKLDKITKCIWKLCKFISSKQSLLKQKQKQMWILKQVQCEEQVLK